MYDATQWMDRRRVDVERDHDGFGTCAGSDGMDAAFSAVELKVEAVKKRWVCQWGAANGNQQARRAVFAVVDGS